MLAEGFKDQWAEPRSLLLMEVRRELAEHAFLPEFLQVIRHSLGCLRPIRFRFEERTDLVGHLDEALNLHEC